MKKKVQSSYYFQLQQLPSNPSISLYFVRNVSFHPMIEKLQERQPWEQKTTPIGIDHRGITNTKRSSENNP